MTANSEFQARTPRGVCVCYPEQAWSFLRGERGLGGAAFPLGMLSFDDRRNLLAFPVKITV